MTRVQVRVHVAPGPRGRHQLVLEGCDPPADVVDGNGLDKQSAPCQAEAAHLAPSVLLLGLQQVQIPGTLHVHMGALDRRTQQVSVNHKL